MGAVLHARVQCTDKASFGKGSCLQSRLRNCTNGAKRPTDSVGERLAAPVAGFLYFADDVG